MLDLALEELETGRASIYDCDPGGRTVGHWGMFVRIKRAFGGMLISTHVQC